MNPSDAALVRWEWVETIGWLAVIVGCFGEGIAEFTKCPKNEDKRHKLGKVSWLILIAGLALEFWGSGRVAHIKDERVAALNLKASQAEERAASESKERAKFELELEKLKDRVKPRTITGEQSLKFMTVSKALPKGEVSIATSVGDTETVNFIGQFITLLTNAGFTISSSMNYGDPINFENTQHVGVGVHSSTNAPVHAQSLLLALIASGFGPVRFTNGPAPRLSDVPVNGVRIYIGPKPVPQP